MSVCIVAGYFCGAIFSVVYVGRIFGYSIVLSLVFAYALCRVTFFCLQVVCLLGMDGALVSIFSCFVISRRMVFWLPWFFILVAISLSGVVVWFLRNDSHSSFATTFYYLYLSLLVYIFSWLYDGQRKHLSYFLFPRFFWFITYADIRLF